MFNLPHSCYIIELLRTYTHKCRSSCSLSKSISPDSKFASVTCFAVYLPVRTIINRGRIQMTVAYVASKAPLMPIL